MAPHDDDPGGTAMTLFGWDSSHYDGELTEKILARAKAEGISFWTHKIGEGLDYTDRTAKAAFTAAKAVGFQVIGGYYYVLGDVNPEAQAERCVRLADLQAPWWREFPGWFWQTDAERSASGLPSPDVVKRFSDRLADLTGRTVIVYASAGQYGDRLAGIGHQLWNARYGRNKVGPFKDLYPGDKSRGWKKYSGQEPLLLQYGSRTTIAGVTTCDADAFRGTIDDLLNVIGADMPLTDTDVDRILGRDKIKNPAGRGDSPLHSPPGNNPSTQWGFAVGDTWDQVYKVHDAVNKVLEKLAGIVKTETAIQDALTALAADKSVDISALAEQIKSVGDTESSTVAELQEQNRQLSTDIANLREEVATLQRQNSDLRTEVADLQGALDPQPAPRQPAPTP